MAHEGGKPKWAVLLLCGERKNLRFLENHMKKKDILFLIVTISLLFLFLGIVIIGIIRKESFCLMIWLVAALLFFIVLEYFILQCLEEEKRNIDCKKIQYEKLDKIFEKLKFPEDELVDIETVITEKKPNGDKESMVTTKKRNLNAELCKKWIDVVADL